MLVSLQFSSCFGIFNCIFYSLHGHFKRLLIIVLICHLFSLFSESIDVISLHILRRKGKMSRIVSLLYPAWGFFNSLMHSASNAWVICFFIAFHIDSFSLGNLFSSLHLIIIASIWGYVNLSEICRSISGFRCSANLFLYNMMRYLQRWWQALGSLSFYGLSNYRLMRWFKLWISQVILLICITVLLMSLLCIDLERFLGYSLLNLSFCLLCFSVFLITTNHWCMW